MKILIVKASNSRFEERRENQTPQDILNLIEEFGNEIIISKTTPQYNIDNELIPNTDVDYTVIIYDTWIE